MDLAMSGRTVLIVEDDRDTREMLGQFLEFEGYTVETAVNGQEAIDRLQRGLQPEVIVLDLMMPVMDGWQFRQAQAQNEKLKEIPVIVVSAAGRDRMRQIDANAFLSKPVDLEELLSTVSNCCGGRPN
jgi:CheY-like chemotaxis protein